MVMLQMGVVLQGGEISTAVALKVGMWSPPDLTLLATLWGFILMAKATKFSGIINSLLWMRNHSGSIIWEAAVISTPSQEGLVMATLSPHRGYRLIGGARRRVSAHNRWLNGTRASLSTAHWRSVTSGAFAHVVLLQSLLLP